MQQARFVNDEDLARGNDYYHRLTEYNNDPKTPFADVQKFSLCSNKESKVNSILGNPNTECSGNRHSALGQNKDQNQNKTRPKPLCPESRTNIRTKLLKHAGNFAFPSSKEARTRCGCAVERTKIREQAAELLSC